MWGRRGTAGLRRSYQDALRRGDAAAAESLAWQIVTADPTDGALWFDLALAAKRRRDWPAAVELNGRALDLCTTTAEEPAAWNLGIAATALGDWARARQAWAAFGVPMPPGDGPIHARLGMVPVRLNPTGTELDEDALTIDGVAYHPEVVWAERLSPAHARVDNVPSADSGHRWGDVVLTDGVPHGERHDGRQWVPVFDELALLERSPHRTWAADVVAPDPLDAQALTRVAEAAGLAAQDWTATVRQLCAACSAGRPGADGHDHHDHGHGDDDAWARQRRFGLAGGADAVVDVLTTWAAGGVGRSFRPPAEPVADV